MASAEEAVLIDDSIMDEYEAEKKHPLLADFLIQYPRCYEEGADQAFLVYQDLTEVRGWWFTTMHYNEALERPYIIGQETRNGINQIVLPLGMEEQVSSRDLQAFLSGKYNMRFAEEITVAIMDVDSTLVYYKLANGLLAPEHPDITAEKKRVRSERMNKRRQMIASCVQKAVERFNKEET